MALCKDCSHYNHNGSKLCHYLGVPRKANDRACEIHEDEKELERLKELRAKGGLHLPKGDNRWNLS